MDVHIQTAGPNLQQKKREARKGPRRSWGQGRAEKSHSSVRREEWSRGTGRGGEERGGREGEVVEEEGEKRRSKRRKKRRKGVGRRSERGGGRKRRRRIANGKDPVLSWRASS